MLTNIFFSVCAIAGTAVLWRNWIEQHPQAKSHIEKTLGRMSPVLLCGSCFTYWLAGALTIIHTPLAPWVGTSLQPLPHIVAFGMQWMALGYLSVLFRFSYVLIQEHVGMIVHRHEHLHHDKQN